MNKQDRINFLLTNSIRAILRHNPEDARAAVKEAERLTNDRADIQEFGVFGGDGGGHLVNRLMDAYQGKVSGETITGTWPITISGQDPAEEERTAERDAWVLDRLVEDLQQAPAGEPFTAMRLLQHLTDLQQDYRDREDYAAGMAPCQRLYGPVFVGQLDIAPRVRNLLGRKGITTADELVDIGQDGLSAMNGISAWVILDIATALARKGIVLPRQGYARREAAK